MRNAILLGFLAFIITAAGVWCISWYTQASHTKKMVEQHIAQINGKQLLIAYDSLETTGFPTHMTLVMQNPRFSGRIDQLLQEQPELKTILGLHETLPDWQENIALSGDIRLTVNALSNQYQLLTQGVWSHKPVVNGTPIYSVNSSPASNICTVELSHISLLGTLWSFNPSGNLNDQLAELRSVDCHASPYQLIDTASNNIVMQSGARRLFFKNEPNGDQHDIRLYFKQADMEITPRGEALFMAYAGPLVQSAYSFKSLFGAHGTQNAEFDLTYKGPLTGGNPSISTPLEINLSTAAFSNDLYSMKGHFFISNKPQGNRQDVTINTRFESSYSEAYDTYMRQMLREFVDRPALPAEPAGEAFAAALQAYSPDENYALLEPLLPTLHAQGILVQSLRASYSGQSDLTTGDMNLADLTLSNSLYGITMNGAAARSADSPLPQANITLYCTNCPQMAEDIMSYAGRLNNVMRTYSSEPPAFSITPQGIEGAKRFLYVLSGGTAEEKQRGNFNYVLVSDKTGNLTVNKRNIMEVLALYREYVGQEVKASDAPIPPQGWSVE